MALQLPVPPVAIPGMRQPRSPFVWLQDLDERSLFLEYLVRYLLTPGSIWREYAVGAITKYWQQFPFTPPKLIESENERITEAIAKYKEVFEKRVEGEFRLASYKHSVYAAWAFGLRKAFPAHMMVPGMETCVRGGNGAADFVPFCWVHILYYRDICQSSLINYLRHPEQPIQWRGHPDLKNKHEPYAISFVRTLFAEAPKLETEFKKHMRFGLVDSPARTVDVGPMSIEDIKTLFYNQVRAEFSRSDSDKGVAWANKYEITEYQNVRIVLTDIWPQKFWPHAMGADQIAKKAVTATNGEMRILPEPLDDYYNRFGQDSYTADYLQGMDF